MGGNAYASMQHRSADKLLYIQSTMWDYDAVTLPAACNSPVLITEGLAGVRGKYGSKIEIRYNGPDLCV